MTEWQPIETAPKDGTVILAYCPQKIEYWIASGAIPEEQHLHIAIAKSWPGKEGASVSERWVSSCISEPDSYDPGYTQSYVEVAPTHWMPLPEAPK